MRLATILCVALFPLNAFGQAKLTENTLQLNQGNAVSEVNLEKLQWLQGYWIGEGFGGVCEEVWLPVLGDAAKSEQHMTGTFRLVVNGELEFSEFFLFARRENQWTLRLKHFGKDFKSWEAQDDYTEFPLIRVEGRTAWFRGLTYRINQNDELEAIVALKQKDGSYMEEKIVFRRKQL
ncbi:MAG: DUF6265 family protein [Planctomycetaceae bacterium]